MLHPTSNILLSFLIFDHLNKQLLFEGRLKYSENAYLLLINLITANKGNTLTTSAYGTCHKEFTKWVICEYIMNAHFA